MDRKTNRACRIAVTLLVAALPLPAFTVGPEDDTRTRIKQTLESRFPDQQILGIRESPVPGIYEVFTGASVFHTDATASYIFAGSLIDTRTREDLNAGRVDELNAIDFQALPFDQAIKVVKGNGSRKLAVFTDPDCPYCRRLEQELQSVSDATIYTFLYPLERLHPQAPARARAIWCAENPVEAWNQWMLEKKDPPAATCKDDPIDELQALGSRLYIRATPTIYLANGRRLSGVLQAAQIEQLLNDPATPRHALVKPQDTKAGS